MLGTIVNAVVIILGGGLGLLIKQNLPVKMKDIVYQALGLAIFFIGLAGCLAKLILPEANTMLFILCLIIGSILGEQIGIEARLDELGLFLEKKLSGAGESFSKGFVTTSLMFCIGTMAVMGALQSGLENKHDILFAKSVLDGVSSVIFASTFGVGVLFSSVSVFLYQGGITLLARSLSPVLTETVMNDMSIIGGILIAAIGLRMLEIKNFKVGNMLPALFLPVIYHVIAGFFS